MSTTSIYSSGLLANRHALIRPVFVEVLERQPEIAIILYTISYMYIKWELYAIMR